MRKNTILLLVLQCSKIACFSQAITVDSRISEAAPARTLAAPATAAVSAPIVWPWPHERECESFVCSLQRVFPPTQLRVS